MNLGETTGTRSILLLKNTLAYVAGTINKFWTREKLANYQGSDLPPLVQAVEIAAAILQTSQIITEYNDLFCLQRDIQYAGRSRRWLYARGLVSKTDQAYELWAIYSRENLGTNLQAIIKAGIAQLETADFKETMQIEPAS